MTPMEKLRIIFFGTPDFSIPVLESLVRADLAPALIVTAPDAPKGRGLVMTPSPVKTVALALGIPVITPDSLKDAEAIKAITDAHPDLHVIAAYGKIIPKAILDIPKHGTLNVHPSLLPKYRGPSPVASALLEGETATGVTIMLTNEQLDQGSILAAKTHAVDPDDTSLSLVTTLFELGGELLVRTIPDWVAGKITPTPQDESYATLTKKLSKADGHIDWDQDAKTIANCIRACTPWPSAWTNQKDGSRIIILKAIAIAESPNIPTGTLFKAQGSFAVRTNSGSLLLFAVTRAGRDPEAVTEYTSWLHEGDRFI